MTLLGKLWHYTMIKAGTCDGGKQQHCGACLIQPEGQKGNQGKLWERGNMTSINRWVEINYVPKVAVTLESKGIY